MIADRIGWTRSIRVLSARVVKGDSYRLKDRDVGRVPTAGTTTEE